MRIRAQQRLLGLAIMTAVLASVAAIAVSAQRIRSALARNVASSQVVSAMGELRYLNSEYRLSHEERPKVQWLRRHKSLGALLAGERGATPVEARAIESLRAQHALLRTAFERLVALYESEPPGPGAPGAPRAVEAIRVSGILALSHDMATTAARLARAADADVAAAVRQMSIVVLVLLAAIVAIAVLNVALVLARVLRPLDALQASMAIVGAGRLEHRASVGAADEVGDLGRAFNEMTGRLQRSRAELERTAAELARAEAALRRRGAQLEAANRELEAFSYSASHDLRAPLQSIDGFSQALEEDYGATLEGEARDFLQRIRAASQHMAQLIDDLLALSRLSRADLALEKVDLAALAREVAAGLAQRFPGRSVSFEAAGALEAIADRRLARVALENLLGNAWKFTAGRAQARVEFGARDVDGERAFYVRDNGVGFDMAHAAKLFMPFQRLHNVAQFPGTGIGLATVRRVVQRHGGRTWAEGAPERGATFYFTLPDEPPGRLAQS